MDEGEHTEGYEAAIDKVVPLQQLESLYVVIELIGFVLDRGFW